MNLTLSSIRFYTTRWGLTTTARGLNKANPL
jgi:hypothetical protein